LTIILVSLFIATGSYAKEKVIEKVITLESLNLQAAIAEIEDDLTPFVENFKIRLDENAKIVKAKRVSGSAINPIMKASIRKCVVAICKVIDLDAEFRLNVVAGACDLNYLIVADIRRSTDILSDMYSEINTEICINLNAAGGRSRITVSLARGPQYSPGILQRFIYNFVSLQGPSLIESLKQVFEQKGVKLVL
jgi:hypothetical protein